MENSLFYAVAALAVLVSGVGKGGFGGGIGVLSVPMMAVFISPAKAAAIMLPLLCLMDIFGCWHYWRKWDNSNLKILVPAAIVGIFIGSLTFRFLSDAHIRIMIGTIAIVFVFHFLRHHNTGNKTAPNHRKGSFWGALAGFTSFGVHAGGPPVNVYLLPQQMDKTLFVGTTVIFFTIVNYVKLIPYGLLGQLTFANLSTSLALSPLAPLGVWLGVQLHRKVNQTYFYRFCYAFLFITGVKLLYDGLTHL
jgi:uncharacterized membrane protein YfcA